MIDFLILFFLTVIGATPFMGIFAKIFTHVVIYLPFVVIFCFVFYSLKHCCCARVALRRGNVRQVIPDDEAYPSFATERQPLFKPPTTSVVALNECANDDGYADRMINPNRYNIQDTL